MHIPALQNEVLKYLDPKPNENFIDCTIGSGGHAVTILERTAPKGRLLGIELDPEQIKNLKLEIKKYGERVILTNDNYANLKEIVKDCHFKNISGILMDLGFSSWHIEESKRGFTFLKSEPLDMRYNLKAPLTAAKIVNYWSGYDLENFFWELGQEQFARQIAKEIVETRRVVNIKNTFQLVEIIRKAVPAGYQKGRTHFATKVFQALRIIVNGELDNLKYTLPQAIEILKEKGRLAVISFHSLEDKIVKDSFKTMAKKGQIIILTKKPVQPAREELIANPRSRSAKIRAIQKI